MTCLDTDILVSLLKNNPSAVAFIEELESSYELLFTSVITSYELMKGAYISSNQKENLELVKDLLASLTILDLDKKGIETAGKIYSELRTEGNLIGEFDILIAAICISNGETLISNDNHFTKVNGLTCKTWWSE